MEFFTLLIVGIIFVQFCIPECKTKEKDKYWDERHS